MLKMNDVYTSYYAKASKLGPALFAYISISNSTPKWFPYDYYEIPELAPSWDIINRWKLSKQTPVDWDLYVESYNVQISNIDWDEIRSKIKEIANGRPALLLCYENINDKNCHREIVAERLRIEEYKYE